MQNTIRSFTLLALIGALSVTGCGEGTGTKMENTADSLASKVETGMDNLGNRVDSMINRNADEEFLSDAVEANTMELRALALGRQKGGKEVKSHAGHMITDHKKLGGDVRDYISKKNISLSGVDTVDTDDDLAGMAAGRDFDKSWANKMVRDHEKVISMFEDARDDVNDPELKDMITKAIPTLKSHLEMSRQLQDKMNKADNR